VGSAAECKVHWQACQRRSTFTSVEPVQQVRAQPVGSTAVAQPVVHEEMKVQAEAPRTFAQRHPSTTELPWQLEAAEREDSLAVPEVPVEDKPEQQAPAARVRAASPELQVRVETAAHQTVVPGAPQADWASAEPAELVPPLAVEEAEAGTTAAEAEEQTSMAAAQTVEVAVVAHLGIAQL
jgi:hypothetical protein